MNRALMFATVAVAISLVAMPLVTGRNAPDRPPGVAEEEWIPLNDKLGFVVLAPAKLIQPVGGYPVAPGGDYGVDRTILLNPNPSLSGYFVVKRKSGWSRVVIAEPPLVPAR